MFLGYHGCGGRHFSFNSQCSFEALLLKFLSLIVIFFDYHLCIFISRLDFS
uniref:Uncharacterized protein n=1 Tax=Anguilla anguilla TaxID=7936 RepID=A0A0E9SUN0_ANGAN